MNAPEPLVIPARVLRVKDKKSSFHSRAPMGRLTQIWATAVQTFLFRAPGVSFPPRFFFRQKSDKSSIYIVHSFFLDTPPPAPERMGPIAIPAKFYLIHPNHAHPPSMQFGILYSAIPFRDNLECFPFGSALTSPTTPYPCIINDNVKLG